MNPGTIPASISDDTSEFPGTGPWLHQVHKQQHQQIWYGQVELE